MRLLLRAALGSAQPLYFVCGPPRRQPPCLCTCVCPLAKGPRDAAALRRHMQLHAAAWRRSLDHERAPLPPAALRAAPRAGGPRTARRGDAKRQRARQAQRSRETRGCAAAALLAATRHESSTRAAFSWQQRPHLASLSRARAACAAVPRHRTSPPPPPPPAARRSPPAGPLRKHPALPHPHRTHPCSLPPPSLPTACARSFCRTVLVTAPRSALSSATPLAPTGTCIGPRRPPLARHGLVDLQHRCVACRRTMLLCRAARVWWVEWHSVGPRLVVPRALFCAALVGCCRCSLSCSPPSSRTLLGGCLFLARLRRIGGV
jgi:hypothetical protein